MQTKTSEARKGAAADTKQKPQRRLTLNAETIRKLKEPRDARDRAYIAATIQVICPQPF